MSCRIDCTVLVGSTSVQMSVRLEVGDDISVNLSKSVAKQLDNLGIAYDSFSITSRVLSSVSERVSRTKRFPNCYGCQHDRPGQRDHMDSGGCLHPDNYKAE